MKAPELSKNERDFFLIIRVAFAIAFGITAGVLSALKRGGSSLELEFGFRVIPAFAVGAAIGWAYWQFISKRLRERQSLATSKRFWVYSILLLLGGLFSFFYPLRFVARGAVGEVLQGIVAALFLVGVIVFVLWRLAKLLNRSEVPDEKND